MTARHLLSRNVRDRNHSARLPPARVTLTVCLLACLGEFCPALVAADELPWYQIEVVVFRHTGARALTEERYSASLPPVDQAGSLDLAALSGQLTITAQSPTAAQTSIAEQTSSTGQSPLSIQQDEAGFAMIQPSSHLTDPRVSANFSLLPESENSLEPVRRSLSKHAGYRVIGLVGWRQAGLTERQSVPVYVRLGEPRWTSGQVDEAGVIPPQVSTHELAGTIKVFREQYLHMQTNLIYRVSRAEWPAEMADLLPPSQQDVSVPLRHQRRMRTNETHYLDGSVIGMIVRITSL